MRYEYTYPTGQSYIRVDCETEDTVYEGGLDKRSSLDSVQQALFFAHLTGKEPAVVIYDTDGQIGKYEHRIQVACEAAGVRYLVKELNRPLTKAANKEPMTAFRSPIEQGDDSREALRETLIRTTPLPHPQNRLC